MAAHGAAPLSVAACGYLVRGYAAEDAGGKGERSGLEWLRVTADAPGSAAPGVQPVGKSPLIDELPPGCGEVAGRSVLRACDLHQAG